MPAVFELLHVYGFLASGEGAETSQRWTTYRDTTEGLAGFAAIDFLDKFTLLSAEEAFATGYGFDYGAVSASVYEPAYHADFPEEGVTAASSARFSWEDGGTQYRLEIVLHVKEPLATIKPTSISVTLSATWPVAGMETRITAYDENHHDIGHADWSSPVESGSASYAVETIALDIDYSTHSSTKLDYLVVRSVMP